MIGAIHDVARLRHGAVTTDGEGRTSAATTSATFRGSVDELSARDVEIAAQNGQTHDIAVRCPADFDVIDADVIVVTEPERLAGEYAIDVVRSTRSHLRLLCSRTTVRDEDS